VGLAFDSKGNLFMTSDSTGEIYVISRTDGKSVEVATPTAGGAPAVTSSKAAAKELSVPSLGNIGAVYAALAALLGLL
jgi:hypothetical protein